MTMSLEKKKVMSDCTLKGTFPFQEKLYSSIVMKMMKSPQDTSLE